MELAKDLEDPKSVFLKPTRVLTEEKLGILRDYFLEDSCPITDPLKAYRKFLYFKEKIDKSLSEEDTDGDHRCNAIEVFFALEPAKLIGNVSSTSAFSSFTVEDNEKGLLATLSKKNQNLEIPQLRPLETGRLLKRKSSREFIDSFSKLKRLKKVESFPSKLKNSRNENKALTNQPEKRGQLRVEGDLKGFSR